MTCVLVQKFIDETDKQVVVLAADIMGSNGSVKCICTKPKLFNNGDFYIILDPSIWGKFFSMYGRHQNR